MKKKNNLIQDMNIKGYTDAENSPLDIDISKINGMVKAKLRSDSSYSERKLNIMKQKKKYAFIAAAAALVIGITAFASNGIITSWESHSSSKPEYTSLPTQEQCIKDVGYSPILIATFSNGYSFYEGSVVENSLRDDGNNAVEEFKSIDFRYKKDGGSVYMHTNKQDSVSEHEGEVAENYNGTDIYYYSYVNKCVPPDYKMTEEDKKAEANGELVFSYGASEISVNTVHSVSWTSGDINYMLLQTNATLSGDELVQMAKEVIDSN